MPAREFLEERLRRARRWARVAGASAMERFGEVQTHWKDDDEGLVTETDRSIEQYLRRKIGENYPGDSVVGEEFSSLDRDDPDFTWYLDPIDGTAAYGMNLPIWTVCLGIARSVRPDAGILWAPALEDEYHGISGYEVRKNGDPVDGRPAAPDDWTSESLLCVTSNAHRRFEIDFEGKCRSLGSSAYHLAMVLDGRAVGALLNCLHVWDLAAPLGMAATDELVLETLSGDAPDWEYVARGNRSRENLIFGPPENVRAIRGRVELRGSGKEGSGEDV